MVQSRGDDYGMGRGPNDVGSYTEGEESSREVREDVKIPSNQKRSDLWSSSGFVCSARAEKDVPGQMREGYEGDGASNEQGLVKEATKTAKQQGDIARPEHLRDGARSLGIGTKGDKCEEVSDEDKSSDFGELRTLPGGDGHPGAE